ncbi:MAG TPA: VWA domain-containing protein [Anaerolineales bacterium]|nr:VWA domain-containing protein [Anaerolineales bacterium]
MRFTSPLFLLLLLLVPVAAWMGWPARGAARRRETLSLVLRLTILLCLIFSLAGLEIVQRGDNLAVVFLMDVSDSMPQTAVAAEVEYVRSALRAMKPDDRSALILFGADALVERSMSPVRELEALTSAPVTNQTDLAEAIQLGLALFPSGYAKRMVILSDGAQTSGDALEAAKFAAASDVQIVAVPFVNQRGAEVSLTDVNLPTYVRQNERFDLHVSVQANAPTRAVVRVRAGDQIVYEQTHELRRGAQTLSLPFTAGQPGFVNYQVQIAPEQDSFYQNNRLDAYSEVEGPPRILVVAPQPGESLPGGETRPDETSALVGALQAARFQVELIRPAHLPSDLPGLARYDSVVLVDVPARMLGNNQMENLQAYVHDLGGGLVVVGGPTSYGVGGYFHTPLEAALPLEMQIKDEQRRPSLGIVFIIDHSGSMSDASGGVEKIELAKEAAARSIEMLFPTDRIGVIAFDDTAAWVVPMTELGDPSQVIGAIGTIRADGGTDILGGLQAMANVLPDDPAKVKHVILLTDGGADPTGIPELVQRLYQENGITLSTVGVGNDAAPFLKDLAVLGAGRYHFTNDASSIPSIFTEETSLATRAYLVEEPFFPTLVNSSPILAGLSEVPRLYGYVAASPKDLAQVVLQSEKKDPILATWQYGLGRSVAFTSDATGRWARDWLQWDGFPTFWVQAVRYTIGSSANTALEMSVKPEGGQMRLTLDANNPAGEFLNGYQVEANIVSPGGEAQSATLKQIAPGRYEAFFDPKEQGVYLIHFSGQSPDGQTSGSFVETIGWTLSYSPEYKSLDSNPDLLLRLVAVSGGKIATADPAEAFTHDLRATHASHPIWSWLVLLAALLLPFDIAARRLIVTRQDIVHLREWLAKRVGTQKAAAPQAKQPVPQLQALFKAKERAHEDTRSHRPLPTAEGNASHSPDQGDQIEAPSPEPEGDAQERAVQPAGTTSSTTASLLAHKKALRKKPK